MAKNVKCEKMRAAIGAKRYLECSAKTGVGVIAVLEAATRAALAVGNLTLKSRLAVFGSKFRASGSKTGTK